VFNNLMASTNQSPFYQRAEREFQEATTDEERLACLEIMMKEVPKHKSSENMRKNLTIRYKKLKEGMVKRKRSGKGKQAGIKKADIQTVIVGFPNVGKSTLFRTLTGQDVAISMNPFTTSVLQLGTFYFEDAQIQVVDMPAFPNHDKGVVNSADTVLLVVDNLDQIEKAEDFIYRVQGEVFLILNKVSDNNKRKIEETLRSKFKKYKYKIIDCESPSSANLNELKKSIFETFPIIRVYTKEPRKEPSKEPMILDKDSTFRGAVEKILSGMSKRVKRARVWGPSSKFGGQVVGLDHVLKDKDVVEFQTE
jgi:uncharacterized protein